MRLHACAWDLWHMLNLHQVGLVVPDADSDVQHHKANSMGGIVVFGANGA